MAKSNGFLHFLNFISKLAEDREVFLNIQKEPELKFKSRYFGWRAIWQSLLFGGLFLGGAWLLFTGLSRFLGIFINIILVSVGAALAISSLEFLLLALLSTIKQLRINRRAISWVALVIFLAVVGISLVGISAILSA